MISPIPLEQHCPPSSSPALTHICLPSLHSLCFSAQLPLSKGLTGSFTFVISHLYPALPSSPLDDPHLTLSCFTCVLPAPPAAFSASSCLQGPWQLGGSEAAGGQVCDCGGGRGSLGGLGKKHGEDGGEHGGEAGRQVF